MSNETLPKPEAAPDTESDFNQFLNVVDVGKKPGARATLTLTGTNRTVDSLYGRQVVCEVKLGKLTRDWGITINKPNYRILFDRFGAKLKNWKGTVTVERRAPMAKGRSGFLAIVHDQAPAADKSSKRKKR